MREALIVWGGWEGHQPGQCAEILGGMLREDGFAVSTATSTAAFADPALGRFSLVVPIFTMSRIERAEAKNLSEAVRTGTGLAGFHGGMCDAFRDSVDYQFICGG
ncbi:MAG TPA: ThuA domain-containing protein, partial [Acetobacteraceae bacterium]